MEADIEIKTLKEQILKLKNKIRSREEKHKEDIINLLSIQVEYTESIFDNIEKIVFKNEISIQEIKHIPTTFAKWDIRKIRSQYITQLRHSQSMVENSKT